MSIPGTFEAFLVRRSPEEFQRGLVELTPADLPQDGALVRVEFSDVNYKDALAASPDGKVARVSPLVPGIDLAGVLLEAAGDIPEGAAVLAHGYELGVSRHGGFSHYARVPEQWLVPLPPGLSAREAMLIGTAGFTAAMCVMALADHGVRPDSGPVLVTGATGGVGSVAVNLLAGAGYEVEAATGKPSAEQYLKSLGASRVLERSELSSERVRPLEAATWAGAVDCVGGSVLANVLARTAYGGAVAACGLAGGAGLATTVMPFILRAVTLVGVDSVQVSMARRKEVWELLGSELKPTCLELMAHQIDLAGVEEAVERILAGGVTGRHLVALG